MTLIYQKSGNPTPAREARIIVLVEKYNKGRATSRETIELGLLFFSPLYQEPEAVSILRDLLDREPANRWAQLWLSDIYVDAEVILGPGSLDKAAAILDDLITCGDMWEAAAEIVMYGVLSLRERGNRLNPEKIACLEKSVRLMPGWIHNHRYLTAEYVKAKRYEEALEQIKVIRKNQTLPPPVISDLIDEQFECLITGRLAGSTERRISQFEAEIFRKRPDLAASLKR